MQAKSKYIDKFCGHNENKRGANENIEWNKISCRQKNWYALLRC